MNSESMSKKIVWDLDGTLFDTWETHCEAIRKTYRRIYDADISMAKLICSQAACLIDTIWNIFKDNYMEALLLYQDMFIALVSANKLEDKINISEKLYGLVNQGYEMCLLTGRDKKTTEFILRHFSIIGLFEMIYSIDECNNSKKQILQQQPDKWTEYISITDSKKEVYDYRNFFSEIYFVKWF